jgi:hypothetical protein
MKAIDARIANVRNNLALGIEKHCKLFWIFGYIFGYIFNCMLFFFLSVLKNDLLVLNSTKKQLIALSNGKSELTVDDENDNEYAVAASARGHGKKPANGRGSNTGRGSKRSRNF